MRELERARTRPDRRVRAPRLPCFLPPVPAARRGKRAEVSGPADRRRRRCRLVELVPDLLRRDPGGDQTADPDHHRGDGGRDAGPPEPHPPGFGEWPPPLVPRKPQRADERADAAEHKREPEPAPIVHLQRARLRVLGQPRPRERPAGHRQRRHERNSKRHRALDPRPAYGKPHRNGNDRNRDAAAREGEQQRHERRVEVDDAHRAQPVRPRARRRNPQRQRQREHGQKRQYVPVADRAAQARDALGFRGEPGKDLRPECGADRRRRRERQPSRREPRRPPQRPHGKPKHEEGQVDERTVDVVPGPIGLDRPEQRKPLPADEGGEAARRRQAQDGQLRHRQGPHRRGDGGRRGERDCEPADPDQRIVRRAVAEEHSRDDDCCREPGQ